MTPAAQILDDCDAVKLHANAPCRACADLAIQAAVEAERVRSALAVRVAQCAMLFLAQLDMPAKARKGLPEHLDAEPKFRLAVDEWAWGSGFGDPEVRRARGAGRKT